MAYQLTSILSTSFSQITGLGEQSGSIVICGVLNGNQKVQRLQENGTVVFTLSNTINSTQVLHGIAVTPSFIYVSRKYPPFNNSYDDRVAFNGTGSFIQGSGLSTSWGLLHGMTAQGSTMYMLTTFIITGNILSDGRVVQFSPKQSVTRNADSICTDATKLYFLKWDSATNTVTVSSVPLSNILAAETAEFSFPCPSRPTGSYMKNGLLHISRENSSDIWKVSQPVQKDIISKNNRVSFAIKSITAKNSRVGNTIKSIIGKNSRKMFVSKNIIGNHSIRNWLTKNIVGKHNIRNWLTKSIIGKGTIFAWLVKDTISKNNTFTWLTKNIVGKNSRFNWAIKVIISEYSRVSYVVKSITAKNNRTNFVSKDMLSRSSISTWITKNTISRNSRFNFIQRDIISKNSIRIFVSRNVRAINSRLGNVIKSVIGKNSRFNFIQKDVTSKNSTFAWITKSIIGKSSRVSFIIKSVIGRYQNTKPVTVNYVGKHSIKNFVSKIVTGVVSILERPKATRRGLILKTKNPRESIVLRT